MRVVVPPRLGRPEGRRVLALRVEEEPGRDVLQALVERFDIEPFPDFSAK